MLNLKNYENLPDGVRESLKISISKEVMLFSGENGIISEKLRAKLIQLQILDTSDAVTFEDLKSLLG